MSPKFLITLGVLIGSTAGGYLPFLWGASSLSFSSIVGSFIGGVFGIWVGYKLSQNI